MWPSWLEHCPVNLKVMGLIPGQAHAWVLCSVPSGSANNWCFSLPLSLSLSLSPSPSLPLSLKSMSMSLSEDKKKKSPSIHTLEVSGAGFLVLLRQEGVLSPHPGTAMVLGPILKWVKIVWNTFLSTLLMPPLPAPKVSSGPQVPSCLKVILYQPP